MVMQAVFGILVALGGLVGLHGSAILDPRPSSLDPSVIYLVRHAEKLDDSRDPPLNDAGRARAAALAAMLRDAGITRIWSTDYLRTRHTAAPLAERLGLAVEAYRPAQLDQFAAELLRTPGRHLVVGHSNTTGELVKALGGDPGPPIADDEYDRLYVVSVHGGVVTTSLLRF
jgi:broad specificity phosphatase PhoE